MTANIDDVATTLAQYEAIAIGTGEWEGTDAPEFSNDGTTWTPAWMPTEEHPHPQLARATVRRKGVEPIVAIERWDESVPLDEKWLALWVVRPVKMFGSYAMRKALARAFRDVIGARKDEDGDGRRDPWDVPPAAQAPTALARDFTAEIENAATLGALEIAWADARTARARTGALEQKYNARKAELAAAAWEMPADEPETKPVRPPARDHLPKGQRVQPRKKGRRR